MIEQWVTPREALLFASERCDSGAVDEGLEIVEQILATPDLDDRSRAAALHLAGLCYHKRGDYNDAIAVLTHARETYGPSAALWRDVALSLREAGRMEEALEAYGAAIALNPADAGQYNDRGVLLQTLGRQADARLDYEAALALDPSSARLHNNLAVLLLAMDQTAAGLQHFDEALRLDPVYAEAHNNLGMALVALQRDESHFLQAVGRFRLALRLKPEHATARANLVGALKRMCAWEELERYAPAYLATLDDPQQAVEPFTIHSLVDEPALHLRAARSWAANHNAVRGHSPYQHQPRAKPRGERRLRLGYLSADFRTHAVATLAAGLFAAHDRRRVEVYGYGLLPGDHSLMRARLLAGCDQYRDVYGQPYTEIARAIHDDGIDVLVDLTGYTAGACTQALALRPAPVQVNYLGYPGTMGADFMDYIIGDPIVTPPGCELHYSERVYRLPQCFQINDDRRARPPRRTTRADHDLPPDTFVFCVFNALYKMTPEVFAVWLRLLRAVPDSVLWFTRDSEAAQQNLLDQAERAGIDPARLIFAPRIDPVDHLERHHHADLLVDCFPVGAHTTASDALWMGLPVLTLQGRSFASRVCSSLVTAAGTPGLVTHSLEEYERLALQLATNPRLLADARAQLATPSPALFDTARRARQLEKAYRDMWRHAVKEGKDGSS